MPRRRLWLISSSGFLIDLIPGVRMRVPDDAEKAGIEYVGVHGLGTFLTATQHHADRRALHGPREPRLRRRAALPPHVWRSRPRALCPTVAAGDDQLSANERGAGGEQNQSAAIVLAGSHHRVVGSIACGSVLGHPFIARLLKMSRRPLYWLSTQWLNVLDHLTSRLKHRRWDLRTHGIAASGW
jgi:hypothetical protein